MKLTVRLKGGPGSGHYGHRGRPGKKGGSVAGIGVGSMYSRLDIKAEEQRAQRELAEAGKGAYMFDKYSSYMQGPLTDKDIETHYPKTLHNGRLAVAESIKIGPSQVPTKIAYNFYRGLYTVQEVSSMLGKPIKDDEESTW